MAVLGGLSGGIGGFERNNVNYTGMRRCVSLTFPTATMYTSTV